MTVLTQAGLTLAAMVPNLLGARELGRTRPIPRSGKYAQRKLHKGFDKHLDDIKPGATLDIGVAENYPKGKTEIEGFNEARDNPARFASATSAGKDPGIAINPNADRAYYAHELGHLASQQTDLGYFISKLRQNPNLARAMGISMMTIPGFAASLEAGDNDLDTSIALAALTSAPVLADEALATINAQQIMNKSGLRTSLGQRGKLAGGLLSYLAAPVIAGTAGNFVGNQLDSDS